EGQPCERDVRRERDDGVRVAQVEGERGEGFGDLLLLLDVHEGVEAFGLGLRLVTEGPGAHVRDHLLALEADPAHAGPRREGELLPDESLAPQPRRDDAGPVAAPLRQGPVRSEERRVGKECRAGWWPYQ